MAAPNPTSYRRRLAITGRTAALCALCVFASATAQEDEPDSPVKFEINGYATLGVMHSSEDQADFRGSLLLENGVGYSQSWSLEVDSRVGAQLTAEFNSKLSAVAQVLVEQQADGTYTPHLEWADLKYQLSPDASVRIGRIVLPSFLVSDYRKVGYANVWVRPPTEVYALIPVTSNDGIDTNIRLRKGDFIHTLQASYGQSDVELPDNDSAEARHVLAVSATTERGPASVRMAYLRSGVSIESFGLLFDAFRQFGPEGIALADRYNVDGGLFQFLGAGAQYDRSDWFVLGEVGRVRSHSVLGDRTAWYVSGGRRLAQVTPYLTYATVRTETERSDPGLSVEAYPPPLAQVAGGLNAALNQALQSSPEQSTLSIGVRWDFRKDLDLKLQVDHSRLGAGSAGNLFNVQPDFEPGGSYTLVSLAVDVVF
jgi:Gram-negative porin